MPAVFPKLSQPQCLGCRACAVLEALTCRTCDVVLASNGDKPWEGRRDVVLEIGEQFLAAHLGHDVAGVTEERPYDCSRCARSPLASPEHSTDCINFWNRRAQYRATRQDGALIRSTELGV